MDFQGTISHLWRKRLCHICNITNCLEKSLLFLPQVRAIRFTSPCPSDKGRSSCLRRRCTKPAVRDHRILKPSTKCDRPCSSSTMILPHLQDCTLCSGGRKASRRDVPSGPLPATFGIESRAPRPSQSSTLPACRTLWCRSPAYHPRLVLK